MNLIKFIKDIWDMEDEEAFIYMFMESNDNPLIDGSEREFVIKTVLFALILFAFMMIIRGIDIPVLSTIAMLAVVFILVCGGVFCIKGINKLAKM